MCMHRSFELFGETVWWYQAINVISYFVVVFVVLYINIKKREELDRDVNLIWLASKAIGLVTAFFFTAVSVNVLFGDWFADGHANFFGNLYTAPLVLALASLVFLSEPLKRVDYYAPSFAVALACTKFACYVAGCCYGKQWTYGMYSYRRFRYEYPIQLIEMAMALMIIAILVWYFYSKRAKRGTMAAAYIFLYSFTRFFTEFLRDDFEPILWKLTTYHFQCLFGMMVGIGLFMIMSKWGQDIDDFFREKFAPLREKAFSKFGAILSRRKYPENEVS